MNVVILQSNYIPWKGYFELINDADVFCFYDEVQYTKNDWRNRNKLNNINGAFWLSIPINKVAVKLKISEVNLPKTEWQLEHLNIIKQTYKKAPQFNVIYSFLEDFYLSNPWENLSEMNQNCIQKICNYIGIKTKIVNSKDYILSGAKGDSIIYLMNKLMVPKYIRVHGVKNYIYNYENLFKEKKIELEYKSYGPYKSYTQNTKEFNNFVSVLDLLMFVPQNELLDYIKSNYDSI